MANKIDIQSITKLFLTHKTEKNKDKFSAEEDHKIIEFAKRGNHNWRIIAKVLDNKRNAKDIQNRWRTLSKQVGTENMISKASRNLGERQPQINNWQADEIRSNSSSSVQNLNQDMINDEEDKDHEDINNDRKIVDNCFKRLFFQGLDKQANQFIERNNYVEEELCKEKFSDLTRINEEKEYLFS